MLAADLARLGASVASAQADLAKGETIDRNLTDSIAEREKLLALSRERVKMREELSDRGAGSRAITRITCGGSQLPSTT